MRKITNTTPIIDGSDFQRVSAEITSRVEPVVIKGLIKHWPLVQAGLTSDAEAITYLKQHYSGKPAGVYFGEPEIDGRFFYDETVTKLNFAIRKTPLDEMLDSILQHQSKARPPSFYIASNSIEDHFPSLKLHNNLEFEDDVFLPLAQKDAALLASIWIGNKTLVACHFDAPKNLACCVAGHRRFSLFPPEQIANLYPGPLEPTPGGQVISMVDFNAPDLAKYPRFEQAMAAGQIAELEPGDALFMPSMWWHQVEALSPFNILLNYWWNTAPKFMGPAMNVLQHALLSIKDRPWQEKQAWKSLFEYYIFGDAQLPAAHLPDQAKGPLGELDELQARRLRSQLINKLNR